MSQTKHERNKALVLEAFDTLFNKRDYVAAERYWSPTYIQHSAHIAPGPEGLFNLIKSMPPTLKYEPGMIVADGDLVIVHGRFSGFGAPSFAVAGTMQSATSLPQWVGAYGTTAPGFLPELVCFDKCYCEQTNNAPIPAMF